MREEDKLILGIIGLLVAPTLLKRVVVAKPAPKPTPPGGGGGGPPDMVREVASRPPDVVVQLPTEMVVITPPLRSPDVIVWEERAGGSVVAPMPIHEPYERRRVGGGPPAAVREVDTGTVITW